MLSPKYGVPCLIEFMDGEDNNKDLLTSLLEQNRSKTSKNSIQELPVSAKQIDSFRYRCSDVYRGITLKQIEMMKNVDVKRQILRSPKLKEYFEDHEKERDVIVKDIESMTKKINNKAAFMSADLPSYLIEESKNPAEDKKYAKIITHTVNQNFEESLKKRLASNNLTLNDVKSSKKKKMDEDKYKMINTNKEDPTVTDASRLVALSNRKMWKIRHKKPLKKFNRRLAKKGVFSNV